MELDNATLKHCIFSLLTGLEIQHIDEFMERLTPANCLKLGIAYAHAVRERITINCDCETKQNVDNK